MQNNEINFNFPEMSRFLKAKFKGVYCLSGLNPPLKLILLDFILRENKKIILITSDEQSALKYQKDFDSLFNITAKIFPYQEISPYAALDKNYYIYKEQYETLVNKPDFILLPAKAALEKFPAPEFYKENTLTIEKDKEYDFTELIQSLVNLGYKREIQSLDIGEFSPRGDIIDIYTFYNAPVRIEFFGDTVEDIRFFNPNTQKSFKKSDKIEIPPLYSFILNDENKKTFKTELNETVKALGENETLKTLLNETIEKIDNSGYFEGIEYYVSYIENLKSVFQYFEDYILIFDESALINSKTALLDKEYLEEYKNNLESSLALPLNNKNHLTNDEFKKEIKKFKKIGFDNFIEDDFLEDEELFSDRVYDFNSSLLPSFSSSMDDIADFIKKELKKGSKVIISTAYKNRAQEILKNYEIFENVLILPPVSVSGGEFNISGTNCVFLTDKELFNKHSKDITTRKYMYNKQSPDYIDSVNDIKEGEFVVHYIHGIGIFRGLIK